MFMLGRASSKRLRLLRTARRTICRFLRRSRRRKNENKCLCKYERKHASRYINIEMWAFDTRMIIIDYTNVVDYRRLLWQ